MAQVETTQTKSVEVREKISLRNLKDWQVKKILWGFVSLVVVAVTFLTCATISLYRDKQAEESYWNSRLTMPQEKIDRVMAKTGDAVEVLTGTYVESIKEVNLKTSSYRMVVQIWFRWNGDAQLNMKDGFHVYNGVINKMDVVRDYHENGQNYQLLRCDITVSKEFWTRRFPLESHQLRFYIESEYPVEQVIFAADMENSSYNKGLAASGFSVVRHAVAPYFNEYENTHADPALSEPITTAELVTAVEVNRSSWGLYVKCFIALVGTITWVMIALFLCTYHRVDPLGMIPAALFGTVTNIMVGANLLPDALQMGLLEYVNTWGIMTILAVAISIININRIRNKHEDREFAHFFGRMMFFTISGLVVIGNILLPVSAFIF